MRQYIEICLQAITGHQGRFSDEMETFWRDVQKTYSHCNVPMMPQEHIPIWYTRAMDQCIPVAYVEKTAESTEPERRGPGRPKKELVGA